MTNSLSNIKLDDFIDGLFNKSISDFMGSDFIQTRPSLNVIENEDSFAIELAAPGLEKTDFKISIDKNVLSINVDKSEEHTSDNANFKRREYNYLKFSRRISVSDKADLSKIKASYNQGILKIDIAKKDLEVDTGTQTIEIE
jgi:HSP20 family protein